MTEHMLLVVHLAATAYMTGVIWVVQLVHYTLMAGVGAGGYVDYQRRHMRRITWVVLPGMFTELIAAVWLAVVRPDALTLAGLALVVLIWAATFTLQVPCHAKLTAGFDAACHRRLVGTNWLRTAAWSARCVIAAALTW